MCIRFPSPLTCSAFHSSTSLSFSSLFFSLSLSLLFSSLLSSLSLKLYRYADRIYTFLNNARAVSGIREKDLTIAYELPEIAVNALATASASAAANGTGAAAAAAAGGGMNGVARGRGTKGEEASKGGDKGSGPNIATTTTTTTTTAAATTTSPATKVSSKPTNGEQLKQPSPTQQPQTQQSPQQQQQQEVQEDKEKDKEKEKSDDEAIVRLHLMNRRPNPNHDNVYMRPPVV